jgi:hypothetical protein
MAHCSSSGRPGVKRPPSAVHRPSRFGTALPEQDAVIRRVQNRTGVDVLSLVRRLSRLTD